MLININIVDMERHKLIYLFISMVGGYLCRELVEWGGGEGGSKDNYKG
jgi:hypothetical protein